jgi:hypothetical protein
MGGACGEHGVKYNLYTILVGKPEGSRQLGRPRRRWEGNIKTDVKYIVWCLDWLYLAR